MTEQDKSTTDARIVQSEESLQKTDTTDAARRAALAKIALLTPPAMMTLMLPARAQVGSPPGGPV